MIIMEAVAVTVMADVMMMMRTVIVLVVRFGQGR
jgi:hypothetical protein